jgi:hypothetical protein
VPVLKTRYITNVKAEHIPMVSAPVSQAGVFHGAESRLYAYMKRNYTAVRAQGHMLLAALEFDDNIDDVWQPGCRILTIPLSPQALGGQPAEQARLYEQHKIVHCSVHYVPACPTSTPGALAFYVINDVGTTTDIVGETELRHASTYPSFVQTPVWSPVDMEIRPQDINKRYTDINTGDQRATTQALLVIEAAGAVNSETLSNFAVGNVYLQYDIEFYGQSLSYQIDDIISGTCEMNFTGAMLQNNLATLLLGPATSAENTIDLSQLPGLINPAECYYVITLSYVSIEPGIIGYFTDDNPHSSPFEVGQTFYGRVQDPTLLNDPTDESMKMSLYSSLQAAFVVLNTDTSGDAATIGTTGQLRWSIVNPTPTGTITARVRCVPIDAN